MSEITYSLVGDYYLPNIILSERAEEQEPLGRYGRMRRAYLKE
ncbi:MAG: TnpV protein, partial [Clostridiales Family XIII bacterium]|nr:TnpV protein [Clostridiales Family XIII bacterium]